MIPASARSRAAESALPACSKASAASCRLTVLPSQHRDDLVVGELARHVPGDFLGTDGRQCQPAGSRPAARRAPSWQQSGRRAAGRTARSQARQTNGMRMTGALGGLTVLGMGTLAYSCLYESRAFTLRRAEAPVLAPGAPPMTVLHLSDLHMLPSHRSKAEWLSGLARVAPDLVVLTGDVISSDDAGDMVLEALAPLLDFPGVFVPGNNDYYAPEFRNPLRYFTGSEPGATSAPSTGAASLPGWRAPAGTTSPTCGPGCASAAGTSTSGAWTTPTRAGTGSRRSPARRLRKPLSGWGSPTHPNPGCSTPTPPTASTCCLPATRTAGRSGCRASACWSPTAAWTAPAPGACPTGGPVAARHGCTCRRGWGPRRTRRYASPADRKRRCCACCRTGGAGSNRRADPPVR